MQPPSPSSLPSCHRDDSCTCRRPRSTSCSPESPYVFFFVVIPLWKGNHFKGMSACVSANGQLTHLWHHQCWKEHPGFGAMHAAIQTMSFSGTSLLISARQCQDTYCTLQPRGFIVKGCRYWTGLLAVQTCCSLTEDVQQARMRKNNTYKPSTTSVLSSQMLFECQKERWCNTVVNIRLSQL